MTASTSNDLPSPSLRPLTDAEIDAVAGGVHPDPLTGFGVATAFSYAGATTVATSPFKVGFPTANEKSGLPNGNGMYTSFFAEPG
jgi:hypothetical protein